MSGTPIVVLTPEQLSELVKRAVEEALAEQRQEPAPALLDTSGIARHLGVGTSTVGRLRREGLPCVYLGDCPRFELAECLAWIRSRAVDADGSG
jgi:hypothetical protein